MDHSKAPVERSSGGAFEQSSGLALVPSGQLYPKGDRPSVASYGAVEEASQLLVRYGVS